MNSKRVNQLTAVFLTVLFCFILFSPTINALDYDPNSVWNQHHPGTFTPTGDDDPFNIDKVANRPHSYNIFFNIFWDTFGRAYLNRNHHFENELYEYFRNTETTQIEEVQGSNSRSR